MERTQDIVLEMVNITKRFPGVLALDNVSFSLDKQSVHALVGQNGAGKSTLINVLMGNLSKDEGKIYLNGNEVDIASTADALRYNLACIFQEMFVIPDISVAENIFLGDIPVRGALNKVDFKHMYTRSREILDEMAVDLSVTRHVRGLGVAEQQLIMIARALHRNSRILIMDEPTASLNSREIDNLFEVIRKLLLAGRSVIYISHYLDEIFEIADVVTVLRDGKKISTSRISEIDEKTVIDHMLGYKDTRQQFSPNENIGPLVLEVDNLASGELLKDISLSLRKGEIVGLAGLLGSGRTELVRALYGADKKTQGDIRINGKVVSIKSPSDAVRNGMGLLTEERIQGIIPQFSVKNNITLANLKLISNPIRIDFKSEEKIAKNLVQLLQIKVSSILQVIKNLSGGNQQKVILAKWLHSDTKILLLDEPTKGIDIGAKAEILGMILDLASKGLSVVLISSELNDLVLVCNRILVMKKGRIVKELSDIPTNLVLQAEVTA